MKPPYFDSTSGTKISTCLKKLGMICCCGSTGAFTHYYLGHGSANFFYITTLAYENKS